MAKKKFDLEAYKKKIKVAETPLKKDKFVVLDPCMQEIIGMPGLPLGHICQIYGKSDSGKTSILFHAAAQAQKQGILPVIIITEGKVSWDRAKKMGLNPDEPCIIVDDLEYLEDVYQFIDQITSDVIMGENPNNVMIFWDSLGNTLSKDEVTVDPKTGVSVKKSTMMKAAKVSSENLRVISGKINNTRKLSSPKFVGLTIINTCYTKPPAFTGAMSSEVPYGGEAAWYKCSLVLKTKRRKKLSATKNGIKMNFGIISAISVEKNHINSVAHSGEYVITESEILPNEKTSIDNYKADHKDSWGEDIVLLDDETGELIESEGE